MHELALLSSVVRAVEQARVDAGATAVRVVALQVGALSGALPEALRDAWPMATAGTVVAGAELRLQPVAATVWCPGCRRDVEIDAFFALRCPVCDTPAATLTAGRELEIDWVDLEVPAPDGDHG